MPPLPVIPGKDLIRALQRAGFEVIRQRGSHVRLCHPDGHIVIVPVHAGQDVGRGLLRKILRDADLSVEELINLLNQ
jgi:predicted RNA binding protein YcfA (HicA-like mRNA interferase family)